MEVEELFEMFAKNGIKINEQEIRRLFAIVDTANSGKLDLKKFKLFNTSERAAQMFRKIINKLRQERLMTDGKYYSVQQLPFKFNIMLEYLSNATRRTEFLSEIEKCHNER